MMGNGAYVCCALLLMCAGVWGLTEIECADGYTCSPDVGASATPTFWVIANDGTTTQTCSDVCTAASANYTCKSDVTTMDTAASFEDVGHGLGFTCTTGACWDGKTETALSGAVGHFVGKTPDGSGKRTCYYPLDGQTYSCSASIGIDNECHGERFTLVCPCECTNGNCGLMTDDSGDAADPPTEAPTGTAPPVVHEIVRREKCGDGHWCADDLTRNVTWVWRKIGNTNGPGCTETCYQALCEYDDGAYNACDHEMQVPSTWDEIHEITRQLGPTGFTCSSGKCWGGTIDNGQLWVQKGDDDWAVRRCYRPDPATNTPPRVYDCAAHPGNANCYGNRMGLICPCKRVALDAACRWTAPAGFPDAYSHSVAVWSQAAQDGTGTTCIDRINYYRLKACAEGWIECPKCGLPPMVECKGCHACANTEAQYDHSHSSHASFKRCGESSQGEGGGSTCSHTIDSFQSERRVFDDTTPNKACRGHCGPIVSPGCTTFFWGKDKPESSDFTTLDWRSCKVETCQNYCDNHPGECYTHPQFTAQYPPTGGAAADGGETAEAGAQGFSPVAAGFIGAAAVLVVGGVVLAAHQLVSRKRSRPQATSGATQLEEQLEVHDDEL